MAHCRMDYFRPLAITFQQVAADFGMPAFGLMIGCFTDVMQQTATSREFGVKA